MKKSILLILLTMMGIYAWAVPARRGTITHRQKDGTELTLQQMGDEHFHYYVNSATGEKMERRPDGDFSVLSTATFRARRESGDARRIAANAERIQRLPRMRASMPGGPRKSIGSFTNMTGVKKGLVILVNFQDVTFKSANTQTAFDNQFNQSGYSSNGHIGSVKDYFTSQSYGNFTVDFDVVGPVTVSQNMAYYGGNDSSGSDEHPAEMIIEAVKLANTECGVDFSLYDWGGDGSVDQVFIIYAGYNEAQGAATNTIWPHEWTLSSANYYGDGAGRQKIDGKYIDTYACTSELCGSSGSTMDGIGTACHEFSHCLGYPDLYDTSGGDCWGMDAFDLMDYGSYSGPNGRGEVPCGYSAYERWMAGWLEPTVLSDPTTITNMPALNSSPTAYVIYNPNKSTEYLLLENRQNTGYFKYLSTYSTGHGLLITHVDYNASLWSNNKVNIDTSHERFKYIAADKSYGSNSLTKDYFGSVSNVNALTSSSHTSYMGQWFNGTSTFANMDITGITESNGQISFNFNGGTPEDDGSRYTITYWVNDVEYSWTQTEFMQSATVMTIPDDYSDWTAMGWSLYDYTGNRPIDQIELTNIYEGQSYMPTEDITLYAVYVDEEVTIGTSHPVEQDNTITLNVMGNTYDTWTQSSGERVYTMPTPESTVAGWTFAGWTTAEVDNTSNKPVIVTAGTQVHPSENITYYAVYKSTQASSGSGPQYRLVDSPTAGAEYLLVTSNVAGSAYAIDHNKMSTTAAASVPGTAVTVIDNGGIAIATADENLRWVFTYTNNKWQVKCGDGYMVVNGNGFALKTSSSDMYWSDSYGLYGKSSSGSSSYYIHSNSSTITNSKTGSDSNRIYLYENVNGGTVTYYSTSPAQSNYTVTFAAGTGTCDTASFTQTEEIRAVTLPAATAPTGWTFVGWCDSAITEATSSRPTVYTAGSSYTPVMSRTLYAVYKATSYTGTVQTTWYCTNAGAVPENIFYTISLRDGTGASSTLWSSWTQTAGAGTFTLPTEEYTGWTFYGWASSPVTQTEDAPSVRSAGTTYTPTSNVTFYSVFVNGKNRYISNPALYVQGGGTEDPQFYFPHIAYVGEAFTAPRLRTDSDGTLSYTSSNPEVASVDPDTGAVTINAVGTTIITVTQASTATHKAATATYMIKVTTR